MVGWWFSGEQKEETEGGQWIKTPWWWGSHLFSSCDSLVRHIKMWCRSELISHFVLILTVLTQHDPETQRQREVCTGTVGCIEVADTQHSPSVSNYTFSWNQLGGKQSPEKKWDTLWPWCVMLKVIYSEIKCPHTFWFCCACPHAHMV